MSTEFETPGSELADANPLAALAGLQKFEEKVFEEVATSSKFLPRLQLFSSNSGEVQEGKIRQGHFGVVTMKGQPIIDLTDETDVLLICWRPKALDMSTDNVVSCFNVEDDLFRSIAAKSDDSDSGCMFGPEFLVWIPSIQKFATFFCGSKTARREAVNIKGLCGKGATLRSHLIKKGRYAWHGPRAFECSTPFDLPDIEDIKSKAEDFNNPPEKTIEAAGEATTTRAR
jgi:hypothetical protein